MDFDLRRSSSKLQQEQEKRKAEAARRLEREKKAQEEAKRQKAAIEEAIRLKRLEDEARAEEERIRQEEELRLTAGITYNKELLALDVEGEGDKVTLPASALEELSKQDALTKGPMLFRLTRSDGTTVTHAGVLEFVAEEGTVGLPLKVRRSLGKTGDEPLGYIKVKYVRLEKGQYVKMQPKNLGLSQVPHIKAMLEQNLGKHATLSVGDVLQVWHRGKPFELRVMEVQPQPYVTVIDTDIEVDLDVPEEQVAREAEEVKRREEEGGRGASGRGSPGRTMVGGGATLGSASPPHQQAQAADEAELSTNKARQAALLSSLPPEPGSEEAEAISCLVRRPDGKQATRRFLRSWPMGMLFDFVVGSGVVVTEGGTLSLVTRFPRRVFTASEHGGCSFEQAGLTGKQEAFMVEIVR